MGTAACNPLWSADRDMRVVFLFSQNNGNLLVGKTWENSKTRVQGQQKHHNMSDTDSKGWWYWGGRSEKLAITSSRDLSKKLEITTWYLTTAAVGITLGNTQLLLRGSWHLCVEKIPRLDQVYIVWLVYIVVWRWNQGESKNDWYLCRRWENKK